MRWGSMAAWAGRLVAAMVLGSAGFAVAQEGRVISSSEARFLQKAAGESLAGAKLGRLAQQKALRDEVRQFADRMVAEHRRNGEALMELSAAKRVPLPTQLEAKQRRDLERLQKLAGPDFDRAYMRLMLEEHRRAVKDFSRHAKGARDPDVREFAEQSLATLKDHRAAARATYDLALASKRSAERETGSKRP